MENFSSGAKKLVDEIQKSWQSDAMTNKVVCSEESLYTSQHSLGCPGSNLCSLQRITRLIVTKMNGTVKMLKTPKQRNLSNTRYPGSVAIYNVQPGDEVGFSARSPHRMKSPTISHFKDITYCLTQHNIMEKVCLQILRQCIGSVSRLNCLAGYH